jgi:hypothetical protein
VPKHSAGGHLACPSPGPTADSSSTRLQSVGGRDQALHPVLRGPMAGIDKQRVDALPGSEATRRV